MAEGREPNRVSVERNRREDNLQHEILHPYGEHGSEVVSDQNLFDVATRANLSYEDLTYLYIVLGISHVDVLDAELEKQRTGVDSFQLQAVNVLRLWRKQNGNQATKKALLDAISTCGFLRAKQMLENKWGITNTLHVMQTISEKEILEVITTSDLSYAERKALYILLGIKKSEVEAAERKAGESNFNIQTITLLQLWRNRNGESATKQVLLDAIGECRTMVAADGDESQNIPTFNLKSVRNQLQQQYLETRSKLPLLPDMPEEFARMEDLFVDLHIVEEEKKPTGVIAKELKTYGDIVCITQEVEKGAKKEKKEVKRVLVRGPPGIGKSTAVSKLAYDWACGNQDSPISKFQLLFVITINDIKAKIDLIGVIQDQLLPNTSRLSLEDYLQSTASSVAILFDGYDEASKHFHQSRNIKDALCSKWLPEACMIVTTRPNQVGKFSQNYGPYVQVEILGFSGNERKELYVQKFMQTMGYNTSEFLNQLHRSQHLTQIASTPIILSMLCLLWVWDQKLPSTITALYRDVITHLARHSFAKSSSHCLDKTQIQSWINRVLYDIGKVAIDGLFEDRLVFTSSEFEEKSLDEGCELGIVMKEKKKSRLTVTYKVTFLHKTFQEICAAHFWVSLVDTEQDTFLCFLEKINQDNIFQMEYILRFACGLNMKAAEFILPYIVPIMCQNQQLDQNIYENPCQQLPILLLFEVESNKAEIGQCINLHRHLKPVIKAVRIKPYYHIKSNIEEVLTAYISLQESVKNESDGDSYLWFDDVEEVDVHADDHDSRDGAAKLVCAMSQVTILRINGDIIEHLLSNDFSATTISELYCKRVCCEANRFSQFVSCLSSVTRIYLYKVSLNGELSTAIHLPAVKELCIDQSHEVCKAILHGYGQAAVEIRHDQERGHSNQELIAANICIPVERIDILRLHCVPNGVCNLIKAVKYMLYLKSLHLRYSKLKSHECEQVFDAFIDAKNMHPCNHENKCISSSGSDSSLLLEELDLSGNDVGNAIRKFAIAYGYMPHLRCLKLRRASMQVHHCEKLFDGFIEAGQTRNDSLALEDLDLSWNQIGDLVGKLARAYRSMKHLKYLDLNAVNLNPSQCAQLFDGFISVGQSASEQHDVHVHPPCVLKKHGLALEEFYMSGNDIGDSIGKLAQAYRYMTQLKRLQLESTELTPSHCAVLFDGFITAGKMLTHDESSSTAHVDTSSTPQSGLSIEELDLSGNEIGESVDKLLEALTYMSHLKQLRLLSCKLDEDRRAKIDDALKKINNNFTEYYTRNWKVELMYFWTANEWRGDFEGEFW